MILSESKEQGTRRPLCRACSSLRQDASNKLNAGCWSKYSKVRRRKGVRDCLNHVITLLFFGTCFCPTEGVPYRFSHDRNRSPPWKCRSGRTPTFETGQNGCEAPARSLGRQMMIAVLAEQNSGLFSKTLWYVVRRADDFRTREAHRQSTKMAQ
jgi:hypothetical protein